MGIDYHKQYSHLTFVDEEDKELKSGKEENIRFDVEEFLDGIEGKAIDKFATTYSGTALSFGLNQASAGSTPPRRLGS
jgi:hypothetical protein